MAAATASAAAWNGPSASQAGGSGTPRASLDAPASGASFKTARSGPGSVPPTAAAPATTAAATGLMLNSVASDHVDEEDDEDGDDAEAAEKRGFLAKNVDDVGDVDDDILGLPFQGHSSVAGVAVNLSNTIIGSGIIGLPYAMKQAGLLLGLALLLLVGALTAYSLDILIRAGRRVGKYEYGDAARAIFGPVGFYAMNLTLLLNSSGGVISYCIIVGDSLEKVFSFFLPDVELLSNRQFLIGLVALTCFLPVCLVRDLSKLWFTSLLSVGCIPFILIAIGVRGFGRADYEPFDIVLASGDFFPAIGSMAFAYVCCQAGFILFRTLRVPKQANWVTASWSGVGVATILCVAFATVGYLAFGPATQGNILNNFPDDDVLISVARIALAFTMVFTFPFAFTVVRSSAARMIRWEADQQTMSTLRFVILTLILFVPLVVVGLFVTELGNVYNLMGGLWSVAISYLLPGLLFIRSNGPKHTFSRRNWIAWFLVAFGAITMVLCTTFTIIAIIDEGQPASPTEVPTTPPTEPPTGVPSFTAAASVITVGDLYRFVRRSVA